MYFYDVKTLDKFGFFLHYFIMTSMPLRRAANINPIPEQARILIDDRDESVVSVTALSPLQYFYQKFVERNPYRVNWKKEFTEIA